MTHYIVLRLNQTATKEQIKQAYYHLARETHPDKVSNQRAQFNLVQQAYDTLSDPQQRLIYDERLAQGLETSNDHADNDYSIERTYRLLNDPYAFNHYEFINRLFLIEQDDREYLIPGQVISDFDHYRLRLQLDHIATKLHSQQNDLKQKLNKTKEEQAQLELLFHNEDKIDQVICILTTGDQEKFLYDLSLGPEVIQYTDKMREIESLIGDRKRLIEHVKVHPQLYTATSVFALYEVGCLNPRNFKKLIACENYREFDQTTDVIMELSRAKLLDQTNFDLIMNHKENAHALFLGILDLMFANLLNQGSFDELVQSGKNAQSVGIAWRRLKEDNFLNETNRQMIFKLAEKMPIGVLVTKALIKLEDETKLTAEDRLALHWKGDRASLQALSLRIDEMFAYGLSLLNSDTDKAQAVFLLALELKKSLKSFFAKPLDEQRRLQKQFKVDFLQLLHSKDTMMSESWEEWQIIVFNVAVSLTGLGLVALGVYYLATGQCFFDKTKEEKLRDAIGEEAWLQEEDRLSEILSS